METKECNTCFVQLPIIHFEIVGKNQKRRGKCKSCRKGKTINIKDANGYSTQSIDEFLNFPIKNVRNRIYKYKTIPIKIQKCLILQDRKCAICKREFENTYEMCIDHCHNTLEVRGLLCSSCNKGIGNLKDNIENLKNAIDYLINNPFKQIEEEEQNKKHLPIIYVKPPKKEYYVKIRKPYKLEIFNKENQLINTFYSSNEAQKILNVDRFAISDAARSGNKRRLIHGKYWIKKTIL